MLGKYSDIWNAVLGPDKVTIEITMHVLQFDPEIKEDQVNDSEYRTRRTASAVVAGDRD